MKASTRIVFVAVALVAVLGLPAALEADIEGKGGFFDARFDSAGRVGTRFVQWLWWPYFPIGPTPYVVYASCERYDVNGEPVGSNKIKFRSVTLRGTDSDTSVSFKKRSIKLRQGEHETVTWDAGKARSLATETAVIGSALVQVKGTIKAGDLLRCELGVAELTGTDAEAVGGS